MRCNTTTTLAVESQPVELRRVGHVHSDSRHATHLGAFLGAESPSISSRARNSACNGGIDSEPHDHVHRKCGTLDRRRLQRPPSVPALHPIRACFNAGTSTSGNNVQKSNSDPALNQVVNRGNAAPVCSNGSATTPEDTAVAAPLSCTDADGNTLAYTIVSGPTNGVLSGTGASRTYSPNANFNGSDSFTFKANDGTVDSNVVTFNLTITEVNDAPTAVADSKSVAEDGSLSFPASDLTSNDSKGPANESGQTLTVTAVSSTASTHGSVSLSAGTVTYTPDPDFNGAASFSYTVQDNGTTNGAADPKTATGTVNVTVTEVNDAPDAVNDSASVAEDGNTLVDVLGNDSTGPANESGQTLTISAVGDPGARNRGRPVRQGQVHAERRLQRQRLLHLHGDRQRHDQRRQRLQVGHRHGLRHRHRGQRRPRRGQRQRERGRGRKRTRGRARQRLDRARRTSPARR